MKMTPWSLVTKKRKKSSSGRRLVHALSLGLALSLAGMLAGPLVRTAAAQQHGPVRRTVEGKVRDRNDGVLKGAVVYLKDTRTLAVKTFLSDDEGGFHFGQLSPNADYELYAEFGGKRSKSRTISSFDSKNDFTFVLKVDATASAHGAARAAL